MAITLQSVALSWSVQHHTDNAAIPHVVCAATVTWVSAGVTKAASWTATFPRYDKTVSAVPANETSIRAAILSTLKFEDATMTAVLLAAKVTRAVDPAFPQGT